MSRSPERSLPFRFSDINSVYMCMSPMSVTFPAQLILLNFITAIIFCEEYKL